LHLPLPEGRALVLFIALAAAAQRRGRSIPGSRS